MIPCRCPDPVCFAEHHEPIEGAAPELPPARQEDYWPPSSEDLAEWQRRFEEANTPARMRRAWKRQLRETLPRRVRARLWLDMRIDDVATWLCDHGHERLCVALWRVTGLWS